MAEEFLCERAVETILSNITVLNLSLTHAWVG